jgi:hypothetical protein
MLSIEKNKQELLDLILKCDPFLRDTACQIRVINLLNIYAIIEQTTPEKSLPKELEASYIRYILLCDMLTKFGNKKYSELKAIDIQSSIHPDIIPSYPLDSPTKKEKFITEAKSEVAEESIKFLKTHHHIHFDERFEQYFNHDFIYINSSQIHITLLPCFISTQIMLDFIKHQESLLIVNLTRKTSDNITSQHSIGYRYQHGQFQVIDEEQHQQDSAAVVIDMESNEVLETPLIDACYANHDATAFVEHFKQLDIAKIIMMSAAAHTQLPQGAKGRVDALETDFPREITDQTTSLMNIHLDLSLCSTATYAPLYNAALHYGLTHEKPSGCPIMIKHIYISNMAACHKKITSMSATDITTQSVVITPSALRHLSMFTSPRSSLNITLTTEQSTTQQPSITLTMGEKHEEA